MPMFEKYHAIDYFHANPGHVASLVAVHPSDPMRLHWNGGLAHAFGEAGKHYAILRTYLVSDYMRSARKTLGESEHEDVVRQMAEDAIEKDFYRRFHEPQTANPQQSAAWISPNGLFYPCHYNEHDALAKRLCVCVYDDLPYSYTGYLEERGWKRLEAEGVLNWAGARSGKVTQDQWDTLQMLADASEGNFQKHVRQELRLVTIEV